MATQSMTLIDRTFSQAMAAAARGGDQAAVVAAPTLDEARDVTRQFDARGALSVLRSGYDSPHGKGRVHVVEILFACGPDGFEDHVTLYTGGAPAKAAIQREIDRLSMAPAW